MPPIPKTSVVPPGGFHYIEKGPGGVEIRIDSHSIEATAAALLQFRLNNGTPPGNPQQDVFDFICKQWPHFCHDNSPDYLQAPPPTREEHMSRRAVNWMVRVWNLGANNEVQPAEAARRAAICAGCPMNVEYRAGACGPCIESLDRLGFIWRRQRTTTHDESLRACKVIGQLNVVAAQAGQLPPLASDDNEKLPAGCWRKTAP